MLVAEFERVSSGMSFPFLPAFLESIVLTHRIRTAGRKQNSRTFPEQFQGQFDKFPGHNFLFTPINLLL